MKLKSIFSHQRRKNKKSFKKIRLLLNKSIERTKEIHTSKNSSQELEKDIQAKKIGIATKFKEAHNFNETKNQEKHFSEHIIGAFSKNRSNDEKMNALEKYTSNKMSKMMCKRDEKKCRSRKCQWHQGLPQARSYYPEFFPSSVFSEQTKLEFKPNLGLEFLSKSESDYNREVSLQIFLSFFG